MIGERRSERAAETAATHDWSSYSSKRVLMSFCRSVLAALYSSFTFLLLTAWRFFCYNNVRPYQLRPTRGRFVTVFKPARTSLRDCVISFWNAVPCDGSSSLSSASSSTSIASVSVQSSSPSSRHALWLWREALAVRDFLVARGGAMLYYWTLVV